VTRRLCYVSHVTSDEFAALVRRLEPAARRHPAAYRRKVILFAALGYAFIAAALIVLAGLAGAIVYLVTAGFGLLVLKLLIPIAAVTWTIVRSLGVTIEPSRGVQLRREDVPALALMMDEVNERLRGPMVHAVLLTDDLNASVLQIPRRGWLFGSRNFVYLGLPLLQVLTPEETRGLVAHELGHLARRRTSAFMYRLHARWSRLLESLEERRRLSTAIFRRFFEWYEPRFSAYSFPLRRAHEFEADDAAAAVVGKLVAATMLVTAEVGSGYLRSEYWPRLYEGASNAVTPPTTAFEPLRRLLPEARTHASAARWVDAELRREPGVADTHPSLAERLEHLGISAEEAVRAAAANEGPSGAHAFLGLAEEALTTAIDRLWRDDVRGAWMERNAAIRGAERRLYELELRARHSELRLEDLRDRADLTEEVHGKEAALPFYERVLELDPEDPTANFVVGEALLGRGEERGLRQLERAMDASVRAVIPACEAAASYLEEKGRDEEARRYRERAAEHARILEAAADERAHFTSEDDVLPHDLPADDLATIQHAVAQCPAVDRAYLVRKAVRHLPEIPFYVLLAVPRRRLRRKEAGFNRALVHELVTKLDEIPHELLVVVPARPRRFEPRLRQIPGAALFSR
jgi:Zn-dependent protease with chaperone function